ncbi:hypothetical protein TRFO_16037 [Tritrichomonas foetus]|uniref:Uncharacterized protein n=1 Tax=Tritrichomonas foetus TaxID=1144522 RepID=A0A1J4KW30_9EUKA|nr:hypothetical protein TRFO_16037 [Tritrichomonas foetus]|eukprot:OHT13717.1 hypothetical protein TRFO_16037 [Tritrichomonas foetus]
MPPCRKKSKKDNQQEEHSKSLIKLTNSFLDPNSSQPEIVKNAFAIQLQLAKFTKSRKKRKNMSENENHNDDNEKITEKNNQGAKNNKKSKLAKAQAEIKEREKFANHLISIIPEIFEKNSNNSFTILSLIPSLLQKIDSDDQVYIQQLLQYHAPFDQQLPLLHAISEIPQSLELTKLFQQKILDFVNDNPRIASAALNICIFNFEIQKSIQWAQIARETFILSSRNDLPNSAILLRSKRSCSKNFCNAICKAIQHLEKLHELDFFLILILSSVNSFATSQIMKYFIKNQRLNEFFLQNCPLFIVPFNNIIDALYYFSTSKYIKTQTSELSRLISEAFIASENSDILTYCLYNDENNSIFLNSTIEAISIVSQKSPQLFLRNFDSIGVLYTASKKIVNKLIIPILNLSIIFPQLYDGVIVFLKKMAARPSCIEFAVNSLCTLVKISSTKTKIQQEVLSILFNLISSPFIRSIAFRRLSKMKFSKKIQQKISSEINKYKNCLGSEFFTDLIKEDETTGAVIACDFPSATLELLLSLKNNPKSFFYLIDLKNDNFEVSSHFSLQLALRADVYALLAPYHDDALIIFSEYLRAIDYLASDEERDLITEWCNLHLNKDFIKKLIIDCINQECSIDDPLLLYTLTRQIVISDDIDKELIIACRKLFVKTTNSFQNNTKHILQCPFLPSEPFENVYLSFREELTIEIAQHINIDTENIEIDVFIESMKNETINGLLTADHCQAYLKIFKAALPLSSESANRMFDLLASLKFDSISVFSEIVELCLFKSPLDDALIICRTLLNCAKGEDDSISLKSQPLRKNTYMKVSKYLANTIASDKRVDEEILNVLFELMTVEISSQQVCSSIFNAINSAIDVADGYYIDNFDVLKEKCDEWFSINKYNLDLKRCGRSMAKLQLINNHLQRLDQGYDDYDSYSDEDDDDIENRENDDVPKPKRKKKKIAKINKFVTRKWRSKSKWIDDALKDETDSEDNYADLEDFVVDESPPPEAETEEEESELPITFDEEEEEEEDNQNSHSYMNL